jgi:hypothetical protein
MAAITSAVLAIAGIGVSVYGQREAAKAAEATAKYNAGLARSQADQSNAVAAENMRRKQRENSQLLAAQRSALAARGLQMEGTPLAILGESGMMLERDILDMGFEASSRARSLMASAEMGLWEGRQQAGAMRMQSLATGLSGAAQTGTNFAKAKGYLE